MTLVRVICATLATLALAVATLALGCGGPVKARDVGEQMFADARFSGSDVNAFSCSTCHAIGDPGDRILAGLPLDDAASRTRFWGGASTSLLDATNACVTFFMRGQPLTGEEPKARALYEYLASTSSAPAASVATPLPVTIVENVTTLGRGDPGRGSQVWDGACRSCHGDPHTGAGRITELAAKVPEDSVAFAEQVGFPLDLVVVEKVRHGAFFGIGGSMPPFPAEQLTDEDLGALLAFLGL